MGWFLRSLLFSSFYRLFNAFLLFFFLVQVFRAGSVVQPVRETVNVVSGWLHKIEFNHASPFAQGDEMLRRRFD